MVVVFRAGSACVVWAKEKGMTTPLLNRSLQAARAVLSPRKVKL